VKPLSEQLNDLADRVKQAEDVAAAARANNRADADDLVMQQG
jgi:hypothetical protein